MPGVAKIKEGYNPATWMLEVTNSSVENQLGVDFADLYLKSDLYRSDSTLNHCRHTLPPFLSIVWGRIWSCSPVTDVESGGLAGVTSRWWRTSKLHDQARKICFSIHSTLKITSTSSKPSCGSSLLHIGVAPIITLCDSSSRCWYRWFWAVCSGKSDRRGRIPFHIRNSRLCNSCVKLLSPCIRRLYVRNWPEHFNDVLTSWDTDLNLQRQCIRCDYHTGCTIRLYDLLVLQQLWCRAASS